LVCGAPQRAIFDVTFDLIVNLILALLQPADMRLDIAAVT